MSEGKNRQPLLSSEVTVVARAPVKKSSRRNPDAGFDELRRRLRESNHRLRYVSSSARATAVPRKLANIASSTNLPPTLYERDCMRPTTAEDAAAVSTVLCVACDQKALVSIANVLQDSRMLFSRGALIFLESRASSSASCTTSPFVLLALRRWRPSACEQPRPQLSKSSASVLLLSAQP